MGQAWMRNLMESADCAPSGWCDIRDGAAAAAAEKLELSGVTCGTDLDQMLADLKPDFLVDVTVPEAHAGVTIKALEAGVPVLGEKPMADTLEAARKMIEAAERAGLLYMVSQSRRYDARLEAYALAIQDLGDLGILNVDFYLGPHFGGFREQMESPLVLDMAIHTFDAARRLSGRDAVSVYCEEFNPSWSWYDGDTCATALFEMEGGLRFTYRGSWSAEGLNTSWEGEWRAVGTQGSATWDGHGSIRSEHPTGGGFLREGEIQEHAINYPNYLSGIKGSLAEFLNALKTGTSPQGECHDNFKSFAMVTAALESSRTGQRVKVADR